MSLGSGHWLTDNAVNYALELMKIKFQQFDNRYIVFDSNYCESMIIRFDGTRRVRRKSDISNTELVFFLMLRDGHFTLYILVNTTRILAAVNSSTITTPGGGFILLHLDSLGVIDDTPMLNNLVYYLNSIHGVRVNLPILECRVPQQFNSYDCGVYCVCYIEEIMYRYFHQYCNISFPINDRLLFSPSIIVEKRRELITQLLRDSGQLMSDECYEEEEEINYSIYRFDCSLDDRNLVLRQGVLVAVYDTSFKYVITFGQFIKEDGGLALVKESNDHHSSFPLNQVQRLKNQSRFNLYRLLEQSNESQDDNDDDQGDLNDQDYGHNSQYLEPTDHVCAIVKEVELFDGIILEKGEHDSLVEIHGWNPDHPQFENLFLKYGSGEKPILVPDKNLRLL